MFDAIALQSAKIIGVSELGAQDFEDFPIALRPVRANFGLQMVFEVGGDAIVIQQRVIYVE